MLDHHRPPTITTTLTASPAARTAGFDVASGQSGSGMWHRDKYGKFYSEYRSVRQVANQRLYRFRTLPVHPVPLARLGP